MFTSTVIEELVKKVARIVAAEIKKDKPVTKAKQRHERAHPNMASPPSHTDLFEKRGVVRKLTHIMDIDSGDVRVAVIYYRMTDKTYWKATYWTKPVPNGFNELEDGDAIIEQAWLGERKVTTYLTADEKRFGSEKGMVWRTTI